MAHFPSLSVSADDVIRCMQKNQELAYFRISLQSYRLELPESLLICMWLVLFWFSEFDWALFCFLFNLICSNLAMSFEESRVVLWLHIWACIAGAPGSV